MIFPKEKIGCSKATLELMEELHVLKRKQHMSSYLSNQIGFTNMLIDHYDSLKDTEKKFVLMKSIIYSTIEIGIKKEMRSIWETRIKDRIVSDFDIHEYTVFSWSCFNNSNHYTSSSSCPYMCEIWRERQKRTENNDVGRPLSNCTCKQAA
jgi:hypothetical protein